MSNITEDFKYISDNLNYSFKQLVHEIAKNFPLYMSPLSKLFYVYIKTEGQLNEWVSTVLKAVLSLNNQM